MRHWTVFGALGALALTSPAVAADGWYVGTEAGLLMPNDTDFEYDVSTEAFGVEYKNGYDLDIIAGYDFGMIRAEGELAWKRATHEEYFDSNESIDADGETDVRSAMINVLFDLGSDRFAFYGGGGVGYARVKHQIEVGSNDENLRDGGFAWQAIAGVRYAVNEVIDIGLKYRYFDTQEMSDDEVDFDFTSHSLLFSVIFNLRPERYVPPPPPPPPPPPAAPPPPATQTCPDGTVILATDVCPPPPPPPPPMPEPERG